MRFFDDSKLNMIPFCNVAGFWLGATLNVKAKAIRGIWWMSV
jgi:hypothetical protein